MSDPIDLLTEARRLLARADDILTGPDGASVWWAMRAMADEVERLRAVIDNPGDIGAQISIVGFDRSRLAHAETVTVTVTSAMIRDHLRARLGVSS